MNINYKKLASIIFLFFMQISLFAQKDVTQFMGIPVDGYKPEMIQKLKEKGFTVSKIQDDILEGEFNGRAVRIYIATNNNKVWRIMVAEVNTVNETDIKIRFNNLLYQFQNNTKYIPLSDSKIRSYEIPEDEDISYEITVHKKRYDALFYQKSLTVNSKDQPTEPITNKDTLKQTLNEKLSSSSPRSNKELETSLNKTVWFTISEYQGEYYITIYYDNDLNKAKGDDL